MTSKKRLKEEIRPIRSKLLLLEEKFSELKLSVDYFSGKYDELLKKIQSSNDKRGKLTTDVSKILAIHKSALLKRRKKLTSLHNTVEQTVLKSQA